MSCRQVINHSLHTHLIQCIGINKNLFLFSLLSRIIALVRTSFPRILSLAMHVCRCLQKFHPRSTPLTTFNQSSPVFLFPQPLLRPVSTSPSLSLSSCVSKTLTGEEKAICHFTNQLYPCRGSSLTNLCSSLCNSHLS